MTAMPAPKAFGQSVKRKEDKRFITGKGRYTDDTVLPNQSHCVFVRSPHAHARIKGIDASAALAAPGVLAVLTGQDFVKAGYGPLICGFMVYNKDGSPQKAGYHPALAIDTVRYVGDHVAAVIAETRDQARDAAELVMVDYDELPAVVDLYGAMAPDAAQLHPDIPNNICFDWSIGDKDLTESAFKSAAHVVDLTLRNNRLVPNPMEPRACNAFYDAADEHFTLYLTSQNPHGIRGLLSLVVGIAPEHKLRIISNDVGGGFGVKAFNYAEEVVCLWAAKVVGRPVKWTCDRTEAFLCDAHGRDHVSEASIAFDENHRILALKVHTVANMGAYLSTFGTMIPTYMYAPLLSGQYDIGAIYCDVQAVYTNTAPLDAYRGAGRPEASYLLERILDLAARKLKTDPAKLRHQNFINRFPYQTQVLMEYDVGNFGPSLDLALKMIDYENFPARKAQSAAKGKLRGIGVATYIEACGVGPTAIMVKMGGGAGMWESAEIRVLNSGKVEVFTGSHSHGQGHETTFAQLVSDRFGVGVDDVSISHGDTDKVQLGVGTFGSRSGPVGMSAITKACDKVIDKAKKVASYMLDVTADSVDFNDGIFSSTQTNRTVTFPEVAGAANMGAIFPTDQLEPGLKESYFYDPPNFTFPHGAYICEVEVDPDTGVVKLLNFVAADDFGNIANPMIVHGQVHGGLAQGIGQALLENCHYDPETGQLLTASFMDYCMPRADDLPSFSVGTTVTPTMSNPLGMKGCGEAGAIGSPPALINAICHALDVDHVDMPATPERVWRALQTKQATA
jgi:aerobic carbon-monoxide dehydrogenase large subunit